METDLIGRIKNFGDIKRNPYLPVFEAFINSIQAIEDHKDFLKDSTYNGAIRIIVKRGAGQANVTDGKVDRKNKEIVSFEIEDNGIGFNEDNFHSFCTSESIYKLHRGGKGIGRFSWLIAFEKAEIKSVYIDKNGVKKQREFTFSISYGIDVISDIEIDPNTQNKTVVKLINFKPEYRELDLAWKKSKTIALRTLSHCFFYYINKTAPKIILIDEKSYPLDGLLSEIILDQKSESIQIEGHEFNIVHIKTRFTYNNKNNIVLCATNREVELYPLDDHIGTDLIDKDNDQFYYSVYVSSQYLDDYVNTARTEFNLPDKRDLSSHFENKIPKSDIIDKVLEKTDSYLKEYIEKVKREKHNKVDDFVSRNPPFRYLLYYYKEIYDKVNINDTDDELYQLFYKYKGLLEYETKKRAEEFININTKTQKITYKDITEKYERVTEDLSYVNSADLAKYMIWRKLIIDTLEKKIQFNKNSGKKGKYETEYIVHDLIFPRKFTSDQLPYENVNLWIINENLEYHKIAVSDLENKKFSTSKDDSRADILICFDGDENKSATSIEIIEFKRPMRDNYYDRDPIDQMYDIIKEIKGKSLLNDNKRIIKTSNSTRFYCYLICDITPEIEDIAFKKDFKKLNDDSGFYGYSSNFNAYVEILSFDEVLSNVKKRHQRFFEKLGILQNI
ncbi:hypothetical protein [Methanosarcina acetivorans]|nr:hypothetical protein [Methanosarcina acetivorans]